MFALCVQSGKHAGRVLQLPDNRDVLIGRDPDANIHLSSGTVSHKHCRLRASGDRLRVCDLGSRNGTRLNGERLKENEAADVQLGDRLTIGEFEVEVVRYPPRVMVRSDTEPPISAAKGEALELSDGEVFSDQSTVLPTFRESNKETDDFDDERD